MRSRLAAAFRRTTNKRPSLVFVRRETNTSVGTDTFGTILFGSIASTRVGVSHVAMLMARQAGSVAKSATVFRRPWQLLLLPETFWGVGRVRSYLDELTTEPNRSTCLASRQSRSPVFLLALF
jgi:hypothetical protein